MLVFVYRTDDVAGTVRTLRDRGWTLTPERHGSGPEHFSIDLAETLVEIYPADRERGCDRCADNVTDGRPATVCHPCLDAVLLAASHDRSKGLRPEMRATIEAPWTTLDPVHVGEAPSGHGTPSVYVTVEDDGTPMLRMDVHEQEPAPHPFEAAIAWAGFVVIGYGARVHLVTVRTRLTATFPLSGYFGHLYPFDDCLLVADASSLWCFDRDGASLWRCGNLGVDGVVVTAVTDGVVEGLGEWDPPGGWEPFRVDLLTGARVQTERR